MGKMIDDILYLYVSRSGGQRKAVALIKNASAHDSGDMDWTAFENYMRYFDHDDNDTVSIAQMMYLLQAAGLGTHDAIETLLREKDVNNDHRLSHGEIRQV